MDQLTWIPELVATGFLGFSVAIMYLAYKLLTDLMTTDNPGSPAIFKQKSRLIVVFLSLSASVLILGITYTFFKPIPEMSVKFEVLPKEPSWSGVEIIAQAGRYMLYDPNNVVEPDVRVVQNERVILDFHKVNKKIIALERDLEVLARKLEGTQETARVAVSSEFVAPSKDDSF